MRRRRLGKTNYAIRRRLVIARNDDDSQRPRIVIRRSNKFIRIQLVTSHLEGDRCHLLTSSQDLEKFQWKGGTGNLPAAYLTGYAFGKSMLKQKKELSNARPIADIGLARKFYGSRAFTALKGVVDAGVEVVHSADIFPSEERIRGEHIAAYAKKLASEDEEKYDRLFSAYVKRGQKPEDLPELFEKTKKSIEKI